ncbi:hypothetical protein MVEN_00098600 [Mycena venus]|uniref:Uncharacterized protein n=1 Tax=Mycena venus TaxID=2733690 RepID=A0A8H6Z7W1_9AGAR|nr:hypothetical protein MVEN_00098600 [Mycena venus]
MSDAMTPRGFCKGCKVLFTPTGLGYHLAQTTNLACQAIYFAQRDYIPQLDIGNHAGPALQPASLPGPDFLDDLGNNFDPPDSDDNDMPGLVNVDDSDDEDEPETGWEPPMQPDPDARMNLPLNEPAPSLGDVAHQARGDPLSKSASFSHHTLPVLVDGPEKPLRTETLPYTKYSDLIPQSADNPWAPFMSQVDWEVAKWAKLRGSTTTAVTDLLAIDGYGDPEFAQELVFFPERHYADADKTIQLYHDMHTAEWWWRTQKEIERRRAGGTIVPIIISTDKTQTTMFCNKAAYPVYMTIGNITKESCRKPSHQAYVLLGYHPTTCLDHITNKAPRRRAVTNLYHACMRQILRPLKNAGLDGIEMKSGDGLVRRCHPVFSVFAGDYPEQVLVTGTKTGECPTCPVPRDELGSIVDIYEPRDLSAVLDALRKADGNATEFTRACARANIKPIFHPFWEDLPYVNIFLSVISDILHQLYQGVIKHIVGWITEAFGPAEMYARCRRMPPNHNTRLFLKGITTLSRILDFLYLSQYPTHSSETLSLLNDALKMFHANKEVFIDLGIHADFNFPKLHNLRHYLMTIKLFGTTDNYNTEYTERLHIDLAKDAYRATNRKDGYTQMTLWLERKEKILRHEKFIFWRIAGSPGPSEKQSLWSPPAVLHHHHVQMPIHLPKEFC